MGSVKHSSNNKSLQILVCNFIFKLVKLSSFKVSRKRKTLNFAMKMLYMGIFRQKLWKATTMFEIPAICEKVMFLTKQQNQRFPSSGPKIS